MNYSWSFDGPSPLFGWTADIFTPSTVTGRHGNGIGMGALTTIHKSFSVADLCFGLAYNTASLGNAIMAAEYDNIGGWSLDHIGDGRLNFTTSIETQGIKKYLVEKGIVGYNRWNFFEVYFEFTTYSIMDNGDGTSTVTTTISFEIRINNHTLLTGTRSPTPYLRLNPVPTLAGTTRNFHLGAPGGGSGCITDDIYFNGSFAGDGNASYNGSNEIYTIDTAAPQISQQLIEVYYIPTAPDNTIRITQQLLEVMYNSCPRGGWRVKEV